MTDRLRARDDDAAAEASARQLPLEAINFPRRVLWWRGAQVSCHTALTLLYGLRVWGYRRIPCRGPVLFVSNHQSHLDPAILGVGCHPRRFYALARTGLFQNPAFAWLIRSMNAIPVQRNEADLGAMRACIEVLQAGHPLLIFPEGTRTPDGTVQPFEPGLRLLIKRTKPPIVPVAIEGAHDVWPRNRTLPRLSGQIGVLFGQPMPAEEVLAQRATGPLVYLRQTISGMRQLVARRLAHQRRARA